MKKKLAALAMVTAVGMTMNTGVALADVTDNTAAETEMNLQENFQENGSEQDAAGQNTEKEDTLSADVLVEENIYESREEAEAAVSEKEQEMKDAGYDSVSSDIAEVEEKVQTGTEQVLVESTIDIEELQGISEEELQAIQGQEDSGKSREIVQTDVTVSVSNVEQKTATTEKEISGQTKETIEEAKQELEEQGYTVSENLTQDHVSEQADTFVSDDLYDSEETAREAINSWLEGKEKVSESITEVQVQGGNITGSSIESNNYASEQAAEEHMNGLAGGLSEDGETYVVYSVSSYTDKVDYQGETTQTFTSEDAANAYISSLRAEGYEGTLTVRQLTKDQWAEKSETGLNASQAGTKESQFKGDTANYSDVQVETVEGEAITSAVKDADGNELSFSTLADAEAMKTILEAQSNGDKKIEVSVDTVTVRDASSKNFKTEEEAEAYLATLSDDDYTIKKSQVVLYTAQGVDTGSESSGITSTNTNLFIRIDGEVVNVGTGNENYVYVGSANIVGDIYREPDAASHTNDLEYLIGMNNKVTAGVKDVDMQAIQDKMKNDYGLDIDLVGKDGKESEYVIVWYMSNNQTDNNKTAGGSVYNSDLKKNNLIDYNAKYATANPNASNKNKVNPNPYYGHNQVIGPYCEHHIDGVIRKRTAVENVFTISVEKIERYVLTQTETPISYNLSYNQKETVPSGSWTVDGVGSLKKDVTKWKVEKTEYDTETKYQAQASAYELADTYSGTLTGEKTVYDATVTTTTNTYEAQPVFETAKKYVLTTKGTKTAKPQDKPENKPQNEIKEEKDVVVIQGDSSTVTKTVISDTQVPLADIPELAVLGAYDEIPDAQVPLSVLGAYDEVPLSVLPATADTSNRSRSTDRAVLLSLVGATMIALGMRRKEDEF